MYEVTRRDFLKILGGTVAVGTVAGAIPASSFAADGSQELEYRLKDATEKTSICCFCAVGCGGIGSIVGDKMIAFEGDPDHPVNAGGMCAKGIAQFNVVNIYNPKTGALEPNPDRLLKPRYRAAGATEFKEVEWDWAITEIAKRVKATRDKTFELKNKDGVTVNRTAAIAQLGGAALDNEECHPLAKLGRALGIVYLEHQARI